MRREPFGNRSVMQRLALTGIGMVTPAGLTTQQTCAAVRSGIARFEELQGVVDAQGEPVVVSKMPKIAPNDNDPDYPEEIIVRACQEALSVIQRYDLTREVVSLSILSPETERPGKAVDLQRMYQRIVVSSGLPSSTIVQFFNNGNAAGMEALLSAQRRVASNPTSIELILSADSLLDIQTLRYLERANRLKTSVQPRGLIPGEAAVCLLLQAEGDAMSRGIQPYCIFEGFGQATELVPVSSDEPCLGEGLTGAISESLEMAGWVGSDVGSVYCDMNGEVYRAHEWILASCRTLQNPHVVHPADCIGDVGAASAPLLIGMAAVALKRGYAKGKRVLVFCSSDFGARGSVCISGC